MRKLVLFFWSVFACAGLKAQDKVVNYHDSAQVYYKKKDFKQAARFYDIYYIEQQKAQSNYDTYFAAVASAHIGNLERAEYYLNRSGLIGYDVDNYDFFANDPDNKPLRKIPAWAKFISTFKSKSDSAMVALNKISAEINDTTTRPGASLLGNPEYWRNIAKSSSPEKLMKKIRQFDQFASPDKDNFWTLYQFKVNDTLTVPFMVHIPAGYRSIQRTPLYVYLHGAVINRLNFAKPEYIPNGLEGKLISGNVENALILYPFGKKEFGWLYQQQAFEMILGEIAFLKERYNIDDNRVYLGGHSNGGSGAFWFAVNQPTVFASFFGLNYLPKTYFGNTSLFNMANGTPFYGVSGTKDTTFPMPMVNSIYASGIKNGANWKNFARTGNHGLPFSSPDSISFIFDTLATQVRDPFPKAIQWETDDIRNGRYAWLEITELDTAATNAAWHQPINPIIIREGKSVTADFNLHKSGAVKASVEGNTISLQTSRIKKVKLYISPDMFDLNKPISVVINGKKQKSLNLSIDKMIMVEEFLRTKDRSFIVAQVVEVDAN